MGIKDEKNALKNILIKGANIHNLNNIDVIIPKNKLVIVTGVSGSGKSSLTIDTIYAEGQRRYVESLSSYARQFLDRMDKPDVEYIKGLAPAIAIEQRANSSSGRSTVGTLTELYDYLRLLYAKIGITYSPISGKIVTKHSTQDVLNFIQSHGEEKKYLILSPLSYNKQIDLKEEMEYLLKEGFLRLYLNGVIIRIQEVVEDENLLKELIYKDCYLLIDRIKFSNEDDVINRLTDSIQISFKESSGECVIEDESGIKYFFSNKFEMDGIAFEQPSPQFFNFNSPYGACNTCQGFGTVIGIDENLVIPNKNLSLFEDAVVAWKGDKMSWYKHHFIKQSAKFQFPIHKPIIDLNDDQYQLLWNGNKEVEGIKHFFEEVERNLYKVQYRVMLSRYRGRTKCPDCKESRLRKDTFYVKINELSLGELLMMPLSKLQLFFENISLSEYEQTVAKRILTEVNIRIQFLCDLGLGYLHLNRHANTLSGGEAQRIQLTKSLSSNLTSSIYILDEPSIGLHPHDTNKLAVLLKRLRDLGNTVIVVEHEEEIIKNADYLIDIGPEAGRLGGNVVFAGTIDEAYKDEESLTAKYLSKKLFIPVSNKRRKAINFIEIEGARQHNLKNIHVKIPLNAFTVISGVSGSGKTTLIKQILYPALKSKLQDFNMQPGLFEGIKGNLKSIKAIEYVDQNPIGKSSRSNPVTYIKAYDAIRDLYASQNISKIRGYQPKHFSFNVDGGRCENCKGEGEIVVEMQFLADVHLVCESCQGTRFKKEVREVNYKGKNIADVLSLTIDEAIEFFKEEKNIHEKISTLSEVGLGYIQLGQSSNSLSGGEAQRVKLASFLTKGGSGDATLFIFDEPTTGLHFHDINKLLKSFNALIENGHTVLVIEHNLDVIKCADYLIDLGPKGGEEGGYLLYQGEPEGILKVKNSLTGIYLREKL